MPNLYQIFRETIELIKDMLDVTRRLGLPQEWLRALIATGKIRRILTNFRTAHDVPGASVAIAYKGRLVFSQGYGFADTGTSAIFPIERVTTNHLFRIASLAKPLTSVAVFRLIEAGDLQLGDTVFGANGVLGTTYGTPSPTSNIEQITVQPLLEHTSGWAKSQDPMFDSTHLAKSQAQLISLMVNTGLTYSPPGSTFEYLNSGYLVLGGVIEEVSGLPYADYVRQEVLTPCGITAMHIAGDTLADRRTNEVVYYSR